MDILDFVRLMRTRWLIIFFATLLAVGAAVALTVLTTPQYQASTRLFVSTTTGASSASDIYQGTLSSQQRVLSYTKLLTGASLAQRTINKLSLPITAAELQAKVRASSPADTVLIDVLVLDPSPEQAQSIANALSDEFVVMVAELETAEFGARPDARVVVEQYASLPTGPVIPKKTRNLAIGFALGLVSGIGLAGLRDALDKTIKDREALTELTGVGLVANIPSDRDRRKDPAINFANNQSAIAEAFREFRTNLQFLEVDDPPRVLVITSPMPNEGKSTTALNIALALAEADHEVVLVDGDLRRPKLADYLGLVGTAGLSTVLAGRVGLADVLQRTHFPGLTLLSSGPLPPNPSELLGSRATLKVLDQLRGGFDYVVVDASPLLPVTDAAVLASSADGAFVVARFGKTKREQLERAVANLKQVEARLLGAVFTITPNRAPATYRYGYYRAGKGPRLRKKPMPHRKDF